MPALETPRLAETLVLYVFSNTDPEYHQNLLFFLTHGMPGCDTCEYIFVINRSPDDEVRSCDRKPSFTQHATAAYRARAPHTGRDCTSRLFHSHHDQQLGGCCSCHRCPSGFGVMPDIDSFLLYFCTLPPAVHHSQSTVSAHRPVVLSQHGFFGGSLQNVTGHHGMST